MPKTKEERAAYAKAYRERKKEEIKAQRAAAYKKAVGGEVRPYVKDLTDEEKKAKQAGYNKAHYEAHKEELKERMKVASKERMKEETPEQRAARLERMRVYNAATTAKRRAKKAEEKAKKAEEKAKPAEAPVAKKALPPLTKKNVVKGAVLKVKGVASAEDRAKKVADGFIYQKEGETPEEVKARQEHNKAYFQKRKAENIAKKEAEEARPREGGLSPEEDKARRAAAAEADVEAQKVEAATRARIIAKVKEQEPPREGGLSPDEDIPEYAGPMEGLVPPEPPQPEMGLVAPQAEAPPPAPEKPKGKRELAKEAKQAETIRRLTEMAKNIEKDSERRDVESARKYFDKLRREAGLPKTFYRDVLEARRAGIAPPPSSVPTGKSAGEVEVERNMGRVRAMVAAGGGGGMLPLITGFH